MPGKTAFVVSVTIPTPSRQCRGIWHALRSQKCDAAHKSYDAERLLTLRAWDLTDAAPSLPEHCNAIPPMEGVATQSGKVYLRWLRPGTTRLTLAAFILLGLIFGTSLGYLALAALRAAKSPNDETTSVVATNAPNPSLGDGWENVSYVTREHSSEAHPKVPR
jgi:hypothetical protein